MDARRKDRMKKTQNKILTNTGMGEVIAFHRRSGHKIVFTNGCFDILHVGHVRYLSHAASLGDLLVVGLNSDLSVKSIKGELRPIVPEHQRTEVLAALACVGYITMFDASDPYELIRAIQPDVLVKGADWAEDEIIGADIVKAKGGQVVRAPVIGGVSTTGLIQRIFDLRQNQEGKGPS